MTPPSSRKFLLPFDVKSGLTSILLCVMPDDFLLVNGEPPGDNGLSFPLQLLFQGPPRGMNESTSVASRLHHGMQYLASGRPKMLRRGPCGRTIFMLEIYAAVLDTYFLSKYFTFLVNVLENVLLHLHRRQEKLSACHMRNNELSKINTAMNIMLPQKPKSFADA